MSAAPESSPPHRGGGGLALLLDDEKANLASVPPHDTTGSGGFHADDNDNDNDHHNKPLAAAVDMEMGNIGALLTFAQVHHLVDDVHEYGLLDVKMNRLLIYIFLILIFVGLNVALLGANFEEQAFIEENYYSTFHMAAFWGVFGFSLLEALVLFATNIVSLDSQFQSAVILFNVMATFATAFLFSFDSVVFEVKAHYMEYSVQILISSVNMVFLRHYLRMADKESPVYRFRNVARAVSWTVTALSVFTLILYTGAIEVRMGPERSAHFCEFINEIFNGMFAFCYAVYFYCDVRRQLDEHYISMRRAPLG
jgi:hypothetical protein